MDAPWSPGGVPPNSRMDVSPVRIARDYNRSLWAPVRGAHVVAGFLAWIFAPAIHWATRPKRRWWASPALATFVLFALLLPLDGPLHRAIAVFGREGRWRLGGDVYRELEFIQQFGDLASTLLIAAAVALLDPAKRRRILDWFLAAIATSLAALVLKKLAGRPRPSLHEPALFLGPFRAFPLRETVTTASGRAQVVASWRHAWESKGVSDLWSMPSSHTAAAVVLAMALARMYPALTPLAWTLAGVVAAARLLLGAHYPTDVLVGWMMGFIIARACMDFSLGQRLADRLARRRAPMPEPPPAPADVARTT